MILTTEKKVGHYQDHKCGLYGPWKSADYEQLILDPYEYHFPGAGYLLAMLYCSLHLQRAAEKSTTQTRQEHQSTGNILTRYLENTDFSYIWKIYWLPRLGLVWQGYFRSETRCWGHNLFLYLDKRPPFSTFRGATMDFSQTRTCVIESYLNGKVLLLLQPNHAVLPVLPMAAPLHFPFVGYILGYVVLLSAFTKGYWKFYDWDNAGSPKCR